MITNKHLNDFRKFDFTIEFNVKDPKGIYLLSEEDFNYEQETGTFTNFYARLCFEDISKLKYKWIEDWSFAGRSNGWFVLLCNNKDVSKITEKQYYKIERIVNRYLREYVDNLNSFYNQ